IATTSLLSPAIFGNNAALPHAPQDDLIGAMEVTVTREDTTLLDVAREHDLGFLELMSANQGMNPWVPGNGVSIILPTAHLLPKAARSGIVLNLSAMRLFHFPPNSAVPNSYPIGIGVEGAPTPIGGTYIAKKQVHPTWYPPADIRAEKPYLPAVVPPGPDNPMGDFALYLGWQSYAIHGTNKPYGVGRRTSHGCIRLYPEDIIKLYSAVNVGTKVTVVDQIALLGWRNSQLYLEAHPDKRQLDELEDTNRMTPAPIPNLDQLVLAAANAQGVRIDWAPVRKAEQERLGYPICISY
ncbi:MAG TPA: L,D-transpeptidase family protein, partial [Terrimicrobiaceae bacterium]|nr:L,D-transpeptidase family protein [Terrimicrobiaceae bacterium]